MSVSQFTRLNLRRQADNNSNVNRLSGSVNSLVLMGRNDTIVEGGGTRATRVENLSDTEEISGVKDEDIHEGEEGEGSTLAVIILCVIRDVLSFIYRSGRSFCGFSSPFLGTGTEITQVVFKTTLQSVGHFFTNCSKTLHLQSLLHICIFAIICQIFMEIFSEAGNPVMSFCHMIFISLCSFSRGWINYFCYRTFTSSYDILLPGYQYWEVLCYVVRRITKGESVKEEMVMSDNDFNFYRILLLICFTISVNIMYKLIFVSKWGVKKHSKEHLSMISNEAGVEDQTASTGSFKEEDLAEVCEAIAEFVQMLKVARTIESESEQAQHAVIIIELHEQLLHFFQSRSKDHAYMTHLDRVFANTFVDFTSTFIELVQKMTALNDKNAHFFNFAGSYIPLRTNATVTQLIQDEKFVTNFIEELRKRGSTRQQTAVSQFQPLLQRMMATLKNSTEDPSLTIATMGHGLDQLLLEADINTLTALQCFVALTLEEKDMNEFCSKICLISSKFITRAMTTLSGSKCDDTVFRTQCEEYHDDLFKELIALELPSPADVHDNTKIVDSIDDKRLTAMEDTIKQLAAEKLTAEEAVKVAAAAEAKKKSRLERNKARYERDLALMNTSFSEDDRLTEEVARYMKATLKLEQPKINELIQSFQHVTCKHCKRKGHHQNYCPIGWCYKCQIVGHTDKVCPHLSK